MFYVYYNNFQATSLFLSWRVSEAERHYSASPRDEEHLPHHQNNNELSDSQPDKYAEWPGQQSLFHPLQEHGHLNSVIGSIGTYSTRLKDYDFVVYKDNRNLHLGDKVRLSH